MRRGPFEHPLGPHFLSSKPVSVEELTGDLSVSWGAWEHALGQPMKMGPEGHGGGVKKPLQEGGHTGCVSREAGQKTG